jgi:hypothetical protein
MNIIVFMKALYIKYAAAVMRSRNGGNITIMALKKTKPSTLLVLCLALSLIFASMSAIGSTRAYAFTSSDADTAMEAFNAKFCDADGTTQATVLATGKKVIVTAQDGITKVTYTVIVNAAGSTHQH